MKNMTKKQTIRIAIVEDEEALLDLYVTLLKKEGYEVDQAKNGEEGLELLKKGAYDLVLLDIMLPRMDAFEILENLKNIKPLPQDFAKIVVLTNLSQEQTIAKATEMGLQGYMVKSNYNPEEFIEQVKEFLKAK